MAGSEVIEIIWERAHTPGLGALTLHLVDQGFSHSKINRLINEIKETFYGRKEWVLLLQFTVKETSMISNIMVVLSKLDR